VSVNFKMKYKFIKKECFKVSLVTLVLFSGALFSGFSWSEDSLSQDRQELERKLQLRDSAIIELLERVESLEQRVGVQRRTKSTDESSEKDDSAHTKGEFSQTPGAVVVDEEDAERALERSLTLEGALLLPSGVLEIEPGFSYARREKTAPGFVTVGPEVFASEIELNANILTYNLALRLGLPWESQLEIGVPYRKSKVESVTNINFAPTTSTKQSNSELGDVSIGFATTLLREELWQPDLVARLTWDTVADDADGFQELRASLTAIKRQDPATFIGGISYQHTFERELRKPGAVISANFGSLIALSPETSMRFLFSGAHQNETELSERKIDGSDRTIGTFVVGGSTLLAPGTLLNLSVGIGLTDDADDFSITLSLPIRIDQKFFK
jgi:hypothetical protein